MSKLLCAGWKSVSLVDVHGHPVFTLWLCGCNLKCPFCHNWRLAESDPAVCRWLDISEVFEKVCESRSLVDYLHVTGGEPLLQFSGLKKLFQLAKEAGLPTSLNSNLTLYESFRSLVEEGLVNHVATDLKVPPEEIYGLKVDLVEQLWSSFKKSLLLIRQKGIPLELRIPLHSGLNASYLSNILNELEKYLVAENTVVVLNQLLGEPLVNPRNPVWVKTMTRVSDELVRELRALFLSRGFSAVHVRSIQGFWS